MTDALTPPTWVLAGTFAKPYNITVYVADGVVKLVFPDEWDKSGICENHAFDVPIKVILEKPMTNEPLSTDGALYDVIAGKRLIRDSDTLEIHQDCLVFNRGQGDARAFLLEGWRIHHPEGSREWAQQMYDEGTAVRGVSWHIGYFISKTVSNAANKAPPKTWSVDEVWELCTEPKRAVGWYMVTDKMFENHFVWWNGKNWKTDLGEDPFPHGVPSLVRIRPCIIGEPET